MAGVVVMFFRGKNAVAVAVVVLCCVALFGAVQCGIGVQGACFELDGTRRRDSGAGSTGSVLGYYHPGAGVGVDVLVVARPARGGVNLRVNIAILRLSERERGGREKDLQPETETWERSSRLVVVGFGLCWIKHAPNAGTRQSIQPKRSESNVDGRPELRVCV